MAAWTTTKIDQFNGDRYSSSSGLRDTYEKRGSRKREQGVRRIRSMLTFFKEINSFKVSPEKTQPRAAKVTLCLLHISLCSRFVFRKDLQRN